MARTLLREIGTMAETAMLERKRKLHHLGPAACLLVLAGPASAQDDAGAAGDAEPNAATPEAVGAVAVCAVCHGAEGEGRPQLEAPRIGGLPAWYVTRQLDHFRKGIRGGTAADVYGTQMHAIALSLENGATLEDLGEHFASLSPPPAETTLDGDAARGEELYSICVACHGEQARGSEELNTPPLVGMPDWYLLRQLENFRKGLRGGSSADRFGAQMIPIMSTLESHEDLVDLVAYINSLGRANAGAPAE